MAEVTKHCPGMFCWVELNTVDALAANRFYGEMFGWRRSFMPLDDGSFYTLLQLDGKDVGAFHEIFEEALEPETTTGWRLYIATDNVDQSVQKALSLGGALVTPPVEVSDVGRVAVMQDPTGAVFALWQARNHIGAEVVNQSGALSWQELITTDFETAKQFYSNLFGWQTQTRAAGARSYTTFKPKKSSLESGGIQPLHGPLQETLSENGSQWLASFAVENFEQSLHKAQRLGATLKTPPAEVPNVGRYAVLEDPQGALFSLVSPPQENYWALRAAA
jgi:predicted enzyme related to lactoylglutathione lyase